jgi:hypothetical protein
VNTPAHQMPTIKEGSTIGFRFGVGTWCAIIGTIGGGIVILVGFCLWLNTMHVDVQALKDAQRRQAEASERIEAIVRDIEFRQRYGITAGIPPTAGRNAP